MQLGSLSFVPSNLLATILNSEVPELNSIARLTVTFGAFLCLLFEINRGMVIFVAFLKDAQLDDVIKLGMRKRIILRLLFSI